MVVWKSQAEDEPLAEGHVDWSFDEEMSPEGLQRKLYREAATEEVLLRDREELLTKGWPLSLEDEW